MIESDYQRGMFSGEGACFQLVLTDCTLLKYQVFTQAPLTELAQLVALAPEFLSVYENGPRC